MQIRASILLGALALFAFGGVQAAHAQGVFTLSSTGFKDGERLATKFAGNNKSNPNCVGENISPALSWANPPEGTKSYAILMFDIDGRPPGGVSHWVAYGIPASVTGFAEGEVSKPSDKYVGGQSLMKLANYFGPCASLHFHPDGDRSRADRPERGHDARRTHQGAGRPRQGCDQPGRHLLQAVTVQT